MGCRMWQGCGFSFRHAPIAPFLIYDADSHRFRLQEPVACLLGYRAGSRYAFWGATHKFFRYPIATTHLAGAVAVVDGKQYPNGRTLYSPQLSAPTLRRLDFPNHTPKCVYAPSNMPIEPRCIGRKASQKSSEYCYPLQCNYYTPLIPQHYNLTLFISS